MYRKRLVTKNNGQAEPCLLNVYLALKFDNAWRGVLGFDEFSYRVTKRQAPPFAEGKVGEWTDQDDSFTAVWLAQEKGLALRVPSSMVAEAVQMVAQENSFHPVRDWCDQLTWDETTRLWGLFPVFLGSSVSHHAELKETESFYMATVATRWLLSAVARVYEPGCKADYMIILEGRQGLGKSAFLRDLFTDEWFADTPFVMGDKDSYQVLRGKWCVEIAELDSFNKADITRAKAFVSSQVDNYRPSYGRRNRDHPRQCIFGGTTNQDEYFRDSTGNRRFWPIFVTKYDRAEFLKVRDQVWAEAVYLYKQGAAWLKEHPAADAPPEEFRWWPTPKESAVIEHHCAFREIRDPWVDFIGAWLQSDEVLPAERVGEPLSSDRYLTTARILREALKVDIGRMDERAMATRVGKCMKQLGYVKRQAGGREQRESARYFYVERDRPKKTEAPK